MKIRCARCGVRIDGPSGGVCPTCAAEIAAKAATSDEPRRRPTPCPEGGLYPGPTATVLTNKELAALMRRKAWKEGIRHAEAEMALGLAAGRGTR